MTDEVAPRIEEKPATYKKKLQVWLMVAFGSVLVLLLILTIINIFSKMGGDRPPQQAAEQQTQQPVKEADRQAQFDQLVNNRRPRAATPEETVQDQESLSTLEDSFNQLGPNRRGSGQAGVEPEPEVDPTEKAVNQWRQKERLRALDSQKSDWGMSLGGNGNTQTASRSGTSSAGQGGSSESADLVGRLNNLNQPFDETASIEDRRAEVRRRIEEAQRLRASIAEQSASGAPNSSEVMAPAQQQLKQVSSEFSSAPENVVGYTSSNKYNADIAGKLKVPPGTLIPTTLMRKAISDYTGSSLQAIVSHDVYDVSREYVLFPKGTEINIGVLRTRNVNEAISSRLAFVVKEGVLPNGNVIDFTKASSADREGVGAIGDQVDYHFMAQFLGVAAYALVSGESSYDGTGDDGGSYAGDVGASARREFSPLVQKYLNIVPTVTIRPGQSFRVIIEEEMYVEPWSDLYAKYVN